MINNKSQYLNINYIKNFSNQKGGSIDKSTDVKIKCYKCGNEFTMNIMRMDSNGTSLVCRYCLERKPIQRQDTLNQEVKPKQEQPFKEYFCKECKYSFKRAKHIRVSTCPYCDSKSVITKGSTARIIADAARMKGDF